MIIGLMGRIGCGKGTVADLLVNDFGFKVVTIGDLAREEMTLRGLEITREGTTKLSTELLSKDPAYFIKKAVSKIKGSAHDLWIIDGIRRPLDVKEFREAFPDIKFILVDVEPRLRFERMVSRGRADMPKSFDDFLKQEGLENEKFGIDETLSHADFVISNDGSLDELNSQVVELMSDLL